MIREVLSDVIDPALDRLVSYGIRVSDNARVMLLAIGLQESLLTHRFQISVRSDGSRFRGPARGLWQFESGGGVAGVMNHRSSTDTARLFATEFVGSHDNRAIWASLAYEDILAAIFARLLLWTDPLPLPAPIAASEQFAWQYYIRNWRPGKPWPDKWPGNWQAALDAVQKRN